ncbi:hypothetical protein [Halobacterium litoreum]|uniref:Yip1 domain-containing protein n=1 Tax=Halobacterium litoreum TaxID=2039234 RepID=A0ABD5NB71_9EURY|nr:hypothetical protein [Halobacterium litoreum]UHH14599.1 hypothetical protein LT972_06255 [Halobacterium litoreum]
MDWSPLRALVRPERAFDEDVRARVGLAVVLALCVLNGVAATQGAGAVASATDGTVTVDNPDRPGDWICDEAATDDFYENYREACANEPETVERSLSSYARPAADALAGTAFLAPLAVWLAVSGVIALAFGGASADDPSDRVRLSTVAAATGVGLAPAALRYAARPFFVERSLSDYSPAGIESTRDAAAAAMTPESTLYALVVVATLAWSAYVWRGTWRAAIGTESRRVDAVAVGCAAVLSLSAFSPVYLGGGAAIYGILFLLLGGLGLAFPRVLERIELAFDLIGTRGGESVEPKPWRVYLEQVGSLLFVLFGAVAVGGLLFP